MKSIVSVGYHTWRPDILVTAKGKNDWNTSCTYRLTSDSYNNHLEAVFRPNGWEKGYQYRVALKHNINSIDPRIEILAEQINDKMRVLSSRHLFSCGIKVSRQSCPFCKKGVIFSDGLWICIDNCGFKYTPNTCVTLAKFYESGKCKTRGICNPSSFAILGNANDTLTILDRKL
jgi:hypothetical protein